MRTALGIQFYYLMYTAETRSALKLVADKTVFQPDTVRTFYPSLYTPQTVNTRRSENTEHVAHNGGNGYVDHSFLYKIIPTSMFE